MVDDLMGRQVAEVTRGWVDGLTSLLIKLALKENPGREDVLNRDDIRFLKPTGYFSFNSVE